MTEHKLARHFVDLSGREWLISELSADEARRVFPGELFFEDPPTVSLVFSAEGHTRYVAHAPAHWHDLSFTGISSLLRQSKYLESAAQAR